MMSEKSTYRIDDVFDGNRHSIIGSDPETQKGEPNCGHYGWFHYIKHSKDLMRCSDEADDESSGVFPMITSTEKV